MIGESGRERGDGSGCVGVKRGPRDPDTRSPSRQKRLAEFGLKPLKAAGVGGSERVARRRL